MKNRTKVFWGIIVGGAVAIMLVAPKVFEWYDIVQKYDIEEALNDFSALERQLLVWDKEEIDVDAMKINDDQHVAYLLSAEAIMYRGGAY